MKIAVADGFFDSLKRCFRPWWHPRELWYRFKCWAWHRYSTVRARHLPHTWCDRRELLAHMSFEILCQFIEKECSPGHTDWEGTGHTVEVELPGGKKVVRNVRDEMQDLYDWWTKVYHGRYPALKERIDYVYEVHNDAHRLSYWRDDEESGYTFWDPQYDTPENKQRGRDLLMDLNRHEQFVEAALQRRLHRLINIRENLWT